MITKKQLLELVAADKTRSSFFFWAAPTAIDLVRTYCQKYQELPHETVVFDLINIFFVEAVVAYDDPTWLKILQQCLPEIALSNTMSRHYSHALNIFKNRDLLTIENCDSLISKSYLVAEAVILLKEILTEKLWEALCSASYPMQFAKLIFWQNEINKLITPLFTEAGLEDIQKHINKHTYPNIVFHAINRLNESASLSVVNILLVVKSRCPETACDTIIKQLAVLNPMNDLMDGSVPVIEKVRALPPLSAIVRSSESYWPQHSLRQPLLADFIKQGDDYLEYKNS